MAPLDNKSVGRKTSFLSKFDSFRSSHETRPSTSHSSNTCASRSGLRDTPARLRALYEGTFRDTPPAFQIMSPTRPAAPQPPLLISKFAKAFADSLNTVQLSKFLAWFLYYDLVELPKSPDAWYAPLDGMEIRGWIAVGAFLSKVTDAGYGLDLIVLDSICDRLKIQRATVHAILVQFANPTKMAFTQLATLVRAAEASGNTPLETLDTVQDTLVQLRRLAANLKMEDGSKHDIWRQITLERLRGLLQLVVEPRIKHLRFGAPLITAATSEQLPKEIKDGITLKYFYEAVQLERHVPLSCYDIPDTPSAPLYNVYKMTGNNDNNKIFSAGAMMQEIRRLRGQVSQLTREKEILVASNRALTSNITVLTQIPPSPQANCNEKPIHVPEPVLLVPTNGKPDILISNLNDAATPH